MLVDIKNLLDEYAKTASIRGAWEYSEHVGSSDTAHWWREKEAVVRKNLDDAISTLKSRQET
jgi:hypothetical protein